MYGLHKSNSQHNRATFPDFLLILPVFISIISFSQVFSAYLSMVPVLPSVWSITQLLLMSANHEKYFFSEALCPS